MTRGKKVIAVSAAGLLLYLGSYVAMRVTWSEAWDRDGRNYVIFPTGAGVVLYYLYRPMSYIDLALTGTGAHIGPHRADLLASQGLRVDA